MTRSNHVVVLSDSWPNDSEIIFVDCVVTDCVSRNELHVPIRKETILAFAGMVVTAAAWQVCRRHVLSLIHI